MLRGLLQDIALSVYLWRGFYFGSIVPRRGVSGLVVFSVDWLGPRCYRLVMHRNMTLAIPVQKDKDPYLLSCMLPRPDCEMWTLTIYLEGPIKAVWARGTL